MDKETYQFEIEVLKTLVADLQFSIKHLCKDNDRLTLELSTAKMGLNNRDHIIKGMNHRLLNAGSHNKNLRECYNKLIEIFDKNDLYIIGIINDVYTAHCRIKSSLGYLGD